MSVFTIRLVGPDGETLTELDAEPRTVTAELDPALLAADVAEVVVLVDGTETNRRTLPAPFLPAQTTRIAVLVDPDLA